MSWTNSMIAARNWIEGSIYRNVVKPIYFKLDPEVVHDGVVRLGRALGSNPLTRGLTAMAFSYSNPMLSQNIMGIKFRNPIGLAAGFDKNARLTGIMKSVGMGFAELGSITGEKCAGNPKPRLWRLPKSQGLVVYYGLMNDGCEAIYERLKNKKFNMPFGMSIAKTNSKDTVDIVKGVEDYAKAFRTMTPIGDYDTINISCPNAYGGQPFTWPSHLKRLMKRIDEYRTNKPLFLKISPDLTKQELNGLLKVSRKYNVNGLIFSNLTHSRDGLKDKNIPKVGGISGQPVKMMSTEKIRYTREKTGDEFILVGCGGVFTAHDAYEKIRAGASLIQMISGMIFRGPQTVSEINLGLVKLLRKDGYKNIKDAVGADFS